MQRDRVDELMDDPALDEAEHRRALAGLARLNWWSNAAAPIANEIAGRAGRTETPLAVLDIACGSGDVTVGVESKLRGRRVPNRTSGFDMSPVAIEAARARTRTDPRVEFNVREVIENLLPERFDVLFCSLFLHHLDRPAAVGLLREMTAKAGRLVVISDLLRTRTGLFLAQLSTKTLTRSPIVHTDGPRSVRAAFTEEEFFEMAVDAGIERHRISFRRVWPQRFVASWRTDGAGE